MPKNKVTQEDMQAVKERNVEELKDQHIPIEKVLEKIGKFLNSKDPRLIAKGIEWAITIRGLKAPEKQEHYFPNAMGITVQARQEAKNGK